jgi:hypothetical protein
VAGERGAEGVPRGGRSLVCCCRRRHCRQPTREKGFGGFAISEPNSPLLLFGDAGLVSEFRITRGRDALRRSGVLLGFR